MILFYSLRIEVRHPLSEVGWRKNVSHFSTHFKIVTRILFELEILCELDKCSQGYIIVKIAWRFTFRLVVRFVRWECRIDKVSFFIYWNYWISIPSKISMSFKISPIEKAVKIFAILSVLLFWKNWSSSSSLHLETLLKAQSLVWLH